MIQPHLDRLLPLLEKGFLPLRDLAFQLVWDTESIRILLRFDPRFRLFQLGSNWWVEALPSCNVQSPDTLAVPQPAIAPNQGIPVMSTRMLTIDLTNAEDRKAAQQLLAAYDVKAAPADQTRTAPTPVVPPATPQAHPVGQPAAPVKINPPAGGAGVNPAGATSGAFAQTVEDCRAVYQEMLAKLGEPKTKPLIKEALRMHGANKVSDLKGENIPSFIQQVRKDIKENTPPPVAVAPAEVDPMG